MTSRKELRLFVLLIILVVVVDLLATGIRPISTDISQTSLAATSAAGGEAKTTDDCPMPNPGEHKDYWENEPHNTTFKKKDETGKEVEHTNYWGKSCTETKPPSQTMVGALKTTPDKAVAVGTGYCALLAGKRYPECKLTKCNVSGTMKECSKEKVADKDGTIGAPKEVKDPATKPEDTTKTQEKKTEPSTGGKTENPTGSQEKKTETPTSDKPATAPATNQPNTPTETAGQVDSMLKNPAATDGGGAAASPGVGAGEGSATVGGGPSPTDKVTQVVDAGGGQGGTQQGSGSASTQPTTGTGPVQQLPQPSVSPGSSLSSQYGTMSTPASSATQQGGTQQSSRDIIADASRAPSSPSTFSSSQQQPAPYQPSQGGSSYGQQGGSSYGGGSPSFGSAVANFFGSAVSAVVSTAGSVSSAMPSPTQVVSAFTPAPTQQQPQMRQPVMLAPAYTPAATTAAQQGGTTTTGATQGSATARSDRAIGLGQVQQGAGASTQLPGFSGTLSLQDSVPILEGYTEPNLLLSGEVDARQKVSALLRSAGVVTRDDRASVATTRTTQGVASALGRETQGAPAETRANERPGSTRSSDAPSVLARAAEDRNTASFVEAVKGIQEKLFTQGVDAAARDTWRYFQEHVGCQLSGGCADEGSITIVGRVPLLVNAEAIKSSFAAYGEKLPSPTVVAQLHIELPSQPTIAARAGEVLGSIGQGLRAFSTNVFGLFGITRHALPTDTVAIADSASTQIVRAGAEFGPNISAPQKHSDTQPGQMSPGEARGAGIVVDGYVSKNDVVVPGTTGSITGVGQAATTTTNAAETAPSTGETRRAPSVAEAQTSQRGVFGTVLTQTNKAVDLFVERIHAVIARLLSFLF